MSTEPIPARVQRGARLLDEERPGWWRADAERPIDLDRLDLSSPCGCVLGQTWDKPVPKGYSEFWAHSAALGLSGEDESRCGFNTDPDDVHLAPADEYAELTAEWRRVILARRAGAPS